MVRAIATGIATSSSSGSLPTSSPRIIEASRLTAIPATLASASCASDAPRLPNSANPGSDSSNHASQAKRVAATPATKQLASNRNTSNPNPATCAEGRFIMVGPTR